MANAIKQLRDLLSRSFPQNFLVKNPYAGSLALFVLLFVFTVIYRPLEVHGSGGFGFNLTILAYSAIVAISELIVALVISRTNGFYPRGNWTIARELLSILIILSGIGIAAYLAGFVMEPAEPRWNLPTFLDSLSRAILIGFIPVLLPTLLNIRYAFARETFKTYEVRDYTKDDQEALINIASRAKKEHLDFYPSEFLYAESKGNYVVFHLIKEKQPVTTTIRNSISEIEEQLSRVPHFMRTHRAFIVNLNKITSRKGNALGYRLTLEDSGDIVPVSRQNARKFEQMMD